MGKHILVALLGGLLVVGVSTAFAEEPRPADQEVLKAWGQIQGEVKVNSDSFRSTRMRGLQPLTDEELEQIDAGMQPTAHPGLAHIPKDTVPRIAIFKIETNDPFGGK